MTFKLITQFGTPLIEQSDGCDCHCLSFVQDFQCSCKYRMSQKLLVQHINPFYSWLSSFEILS